MLEHKDKTLNARMKKIENMKQKKVFPEELKQFLVSGDLEGSWEKSATWECSACHSQFDRVISSQIRSWRSRSTCECISCSKKVGGRVKPVANIEYVVEKCRGFYSELNNPEDIKKIESGFANFDTKNNYIDSVVEWKCPVHGPYKQNLRNHVICGQGCPTCATVNTSTFGSEMEKEIKEYCKSFGVEVYKDRSVIQPHELDIYIPSKNIAIEVNGSYYHATLGCRDNTYAKSKTYHFDKFNLCLNKGIHLIQIYDADWSENKDRIKNYIKYLLTDPVKVYARKCKVVEVEKKTAIAFCDKYHLQGGTTQQSINYGLEYEGELVSVMSFSHPSYMSWSDENFELNRYCVKSDITIVGGAKRLFSKFVSEYNPSTIISYSDNQFFTGSIYPELKFNFNGDVQPDYYWYKNRKRYTKRNMRLDTLKNMFPEDYAESVDKGNREDYILVKNGYLKVYYPGRKRWVWNKNSD